MSCEGSGCGVRWRRLVRLGVVCVAGLAACANVPMRLEPPRVQDARARVVVLSFPMIRVGVDLAVHNPNAVDVALAGLDVVLDVEGEPVARAALAEPVTLRARELTTVRLDTSGHLGAAIAGVARGLERRGAPLRYEMRGSVELAGGPAHPFVRRGELAWR